KFVTHLTLYIPSKTSFGTIYIKNARGKEIISTQDLHRKKLTLHGGINTINLAIANIDSDAEIEIQGAIQNITLTIPKDVGVNMKYKKITGLKSITGMQYQSGYLYTSTNINQAKKILTLNINIGIGKLKINRE
ncbi:MAG: LiaF domain-containing protein, partial [Candidatus Absconditabacterales bacterium]